MDDFFEKAIHIQAATNSSVELHFNEHNSSETDSFQCITWNPEPQHVFLSIEQFCLGNKSYVSFGSQIQVGYYSLLKLYDDTVFIWLYMPDTVVSKIMTVHANSIELSLQKIDILYLQ